MEFKNVVFNAARDGKLRRLKVKMTVIIFLMMPQWGNISDRDVLMF